MALDYAVEHLRGALATLAFTEGDRHERLQRAWIDNIQMLWMTMCLPEQLTPRFKELWERYTAASEDGHATTLRELGESELRMAVDEVIALALDVVAADARGESPPENH
jgi:hypothetical protein